MKTSITLDATGLSAPELDGLVINPDSITWIQPANPEVAKFLERPSSSRRRPRRCPTSRAAERCSNACGA